MYALTDGTVVQRDWYSSFLLYNLDIDTNGIDKEACNDKFEEQYHREIALIEWIKANKIRVSNSGIHFK
jgi:hypothetical protein